MGFYDDAVGGGYLNGLVMGLCEARSNKLLE